MNKVKLLYNPLSGKRTLKNNLDTIISKFQKKGLQIVPYRLTNKSETLSIMKNLQEEEYHSVLVCGGDGTVNDIVNGMLKSNISIPLGIIPCGTSNDFADYLGIKGNLSSMCDIILNSEPRPIDIGKINDDYFINIVSGGMLTAVAHKVDPKIKSNLGMIGYYLRGLGELPNFRPFKGEFVWDSGSINEEVMIFMVLNSSCAGGFNRLAPYARVDDGKLDVVIIKNCAITELFTLFFKLLRGEHINEKNIEYFQTSNISVKGILSEADTDVDGEPGPGFPIHIETVSNRLKVYIP